MDRVKPSAWSVRGKMLFIAAVAGFSLVATGWWTSGRMEALRYEQREQATQHVVEVGLSTLNHYVGLEQSGDLSREEAQAAARATVGALRYGDGDYYWIHDLDLMMQMHPIKPELDGTDIGPIEDPNGVQLFVEMNDVVRADGAGFVEYMWPKPGFEEPQPKISYVAELAPWGWVIGSGVYVDDIEVAVAAERQVLGTAFLIALAVLIGTILLVRRSITGPLTGMTNLLEEGDLTRRLDEGAGRTELDRLSAAINANMERVAAVVDDVSTAAGEVGRQVDQLTARTQQIEDQAASTAEQADAAAASSREAAGGYNSMANAVSEIDGSIQMISENVQMVAEVATEAVATTSSTNELVGRLATSSAEIGAVVQTITSIAEKTNLLALNATIESSRAGEAGRGFAVVANEVKELAKATALATEDIARQVETLQLDASESASAIDGIGEIITKLNEYQSGITSAVEEQGVTMAQVSRSVAESTEAGVGTGAAIDSVAAAAGSTREQLDLMTASVASLSQISRDLQTSVAVFQT